MGNNHPDWHMGCLSTYPEVIPCVKELPSGGGRVLGGCKLPKSPELKNKD
jgi:hypothetical protein